MSKNYKIAVIFLLLVNVVLAGYLYTYHAGYKSYDDLLSKHEKQTADFKVLQAENEYLKQSKEQIRGQYAALLKERGGLEQNTTGPSDPGNFYVYYVPATSGSLEPYEELARGAGFDEYVSAFNVVFAVPLSEGIPVVFTQCGFENAYFDQNTKGIVFCYELVELFTTMSAFYEDETLRADYITANMFFALNHEIAHAMIDIYDLPVVGMEEDAADQLATLIGTSKAEYNFHAAINYRILDSLGRNPDYFGDHPLNEERYYNLLCLTYGSDPAIHYDIVYDEYLPATRAAGCQGEFEQVEKSWDELLSPYKKVK
ncbi:DUF4344 domain-containing metallopeptidase [archaeon]|nr:DUF4344 domain-containing metallopeptidase [archaeon]